MIMMMMFDHNVVKCKPNFTISFSSGLIYITKDLFLRFVVRLS